MRRNPLARVRFPVATPRLTLVQPSREFLPDYVQLLGDHRVSRWLLHVPFPYRATHASEFFVRARRNFRTGETLNFTILEQSSGRVVGGIGVGQFDWDHRSATVGYWLGVPFWGRGYMSEALSAVVRVGFGTLRLHRLEASTFPGNRRSESVLRKVGFWHEGVRRECRYKDGKWLDSICFGILSTGPKGPVRQARPRRLANR